MKADLLKYKHYLLLLLALLLANYLLVPLTVLKSEQQITVNLLQKQLSKTNALLNGGVISSIEKDQLITYLKSSHDYIFLQESEAEFKLAAQTQVEAILKSSGCDVSRLGFKGNQKILPEIQKWYMEIRYKGDVECLINTTRAFETAKPYINIEEYNYNVRGFDKKAEAELNATLNVSVWYKVNKKDYRNKAEDQS
jgi:hypothetical protein